MENIGLNTFHKSLTLTLYAYTLLGSLVAVASSGYTGSSSLPWEGPLDKIVRSIQGPVARGVILIAVVCTGIGFAIGEQGSTFKKALGIIFGASIALSGASFVSSFFGCGF